MKITYAISLVIYHSLDRSKVLQCLRPKETPICPDQWGLVGGLIQDEETSEAAAIRAGRDKLGVDISLIKQLGYDSKRTGGKVLRMYQYEAEIINGTPSVPQEQGMGTQYQELRWETKEGLRPALNGGSLCSKIFFNVAD